MIQTDIGDPREHGNLIASMITFNRAKTIVEIGVCHGTTTASLCKAAEVTGGHVYGYDNWEVHGLMQQFGAFDTKENVEGRLKGLGFNNFTLTKVDTYSDDFRKLINYRHETIDVAFVDGCHSYKGIRNDFEVVYPKIKPGGIVVFHDTLRIDGCRDFMIDLRTTLYDGTYDIIDFPWGNADRRVGVSILVKRSYPLINLLIDEQCDLTERFEDIYNKEKAWYNSEVERARNNAI